MTDAKILHAHRLAVFNRKLVKALGYCNTALCRYTARRFGRRGFAMDQEIVRNRASRAEAVRYRPLRLRMLQAAKRSLPIEFLLHVRPRVEEV